MNKLHLPLWAKKDKFWPIFLQNGCLRFICFWNKICLFFKYVLPKCRRNSWRIRNVLRKIAVNISELFQQFCWRVPLKISGNSHFVKFLIFGISDRSSNRSISTHVTTEFWVHRLSHAWVLCVLLWYFVPPLKKNYFFVELCKNRLIFI